MPKPNGFTALVAQHIQDVGGNPLNGALVIKATDANDQPLASVAGGQGGPVIADVTFIFVDGALPANAWIPTSASTTNPNTSYRFTFMDSTGQILKVWPTVQVAGDSFNLDTYQPVLTAAQGVIVPGAAGPAGGQFSEHVYLGAAGSLNVQHGLNTLAPVVALHRSSGTALYSVHVVDANNVTVAAPGPLSGTIVVLGGASTAVVPVVDTLNNGLVAHWDMTDGTGTTLPNSVDANNPLTVPDAVTNGVYHFTGVQPSAAYIETPGSTLPNSLFTGFLPFSVSFWLRPSALSTSEQNTLISNTQISNDSPGFEIDYTHDGKFEVAYIQALGSSNLIDCVSQPNLLTVGVRTNVLLTFDGSGKAAGLALYVNGTAAPLQTIVDAVNAPITTTARQFVVMGTPVSNGDAANNTAGTVDNLRFWNRVITAAEIARIQTGGN